MAQKTQSYFGPHVRLLSGFVQAGLLLGVAAYQNEVAESVYESSKKEPLGAPQGEGLEGRETGHAWSLDARSTTMLARLRRSKRSNISFYPWVH